MIARLVFWYEFGSTYSYPAVMRVERVATAAGVAVEWRPFLLGPIFQQQGLRDSPFNLYPAKGQYMWRDLERLCAAEHLPLRRPSVFPRNGLLAARVALIAREEGWCADFSRAVYHANFAEDREIADAAVIADIIRSLGRDPARALEGAGSAVIKERLRAQTDDAIARGIFGAPSFTIGDELFWGNDRLEQAIAWAKNAAT
jgi:2-hydroxychromene-2-carboxylate isomerase